MSCAGKCFYFRKNMTMNTFLSHALEYAEKGLHVFPLRPKSKIPLTTNGFKNATTDPEQIKAWWTQYPDANIGIATGAISGFWVLDIDGDYPDDFPELPKPTVKTRKGYHYYFKCIDGSDITSKTKLHGADVDIRGNGGYIVAPPSRHPDGGHYELIS